MKVITLWQPWASFISLGWKIIETRTHYKFNCLLGETIGIHAGKRWDKDWWKLTMDFLDLDKQMEIQEMHQLKKIPFDKILCTTHVWGTGMLSDRHSKEALIDCTDNSRHGLFLDELNVFPEPITPIKEKHITDGKPAKKICHQGIWGYDL